MNQIDHATRAYLQEISDRLDLVEDKSVVIFCDPETQALIQAQISAEKLSQASFLTPDMVQTFVPTDNTVVIATHKDRWEALRIHNALRKAKEHGLIVALAMRDRRLTRQPPGWSDTGLMYDGMFRVASEYIQAIQGGDYAEFGVFDGNTFCKAFHALKASCRRFFAFDSFAGIIGSKPEENTIFADGQYSCNVPTFRQNMQMAGVDLDRVKEIEGPFQQTLSASPNEHGLREVSIAHIDTDVYEPAKLALTYLTPVLKQGALLLFDDFDQMAADNNRGERRAMKEWLSENPGLSVEPYRQYAIVGRSFIVHRS